MPAPLLLPLQEHFDFSALPQIRVMESFARIEGSAKAIYAGTQNGVWQYDEIYWSERKGAWSGVLPSPARESVGELGLLRASVENFQLAGADGETEPLLRVASGANLVGTGTILHRSNFYTLGVSDRPTEFRLYDCQNGALVASAGLEAILGGVPDGSYLLWARVFAGDVMETLHGSARPKDGEWSAVRVEVGVGAWTVADGVFPSPGAALYRKTGERPVILENENSNFAGIAFDPLARCVSASCATKIAVRKRSGQFDIPVGSQLIGGLRASRNGPQTALWLLREDGTARLLALQTLFTDGVCECAKTNHHASDVVQSPDGTVYVLTECALFRYDPDAPTIFERLPGYPPPASAAQTIFGTPHAGGHPGGNCLRFPGGAGEMVHWTENFGGVNDGLAHYNRMVRRVGGHDVSGPSTLWHGTNCAENYLGRFWAVRSDDNEFLFLDWMDNGRWHRFDGMKRALATSFWQRLKIRGRFLFLFGYKPLVPVPVAAPLHTDGTPALDPATGRPRPGEGEAQVGAHAVSDEPLCLVADGVTLRDAALPYFIRRATTCEVGAATFDERKQTLMLCARGASEGIGPANRVVELFDDGDGPGVTVCAFWNAPARAFRLSRAAFVEAGGDVAKLPPFWVWQPQVDRNAGGVWVASDNAPRAGVYLTLDVSLSTLIGWVLPLGVALPYDGEAAWCRLCFGIDAEGVVVSPSEPAPCCTHAQCAIDVMPDATRFRVIERRVPDDANPLTTWQITDASDSNSEGHRRLSLERSTYPTLWARFDSNAPRDDLTTYTHLVNYGRLLIPDFPVATKIEVVVLITPEQFPVRPDELPRLSRRA